MLRLAKFKYLWLPKKLTLGKQGSQGGGEVVSVSDTIFVIISQMIYFLLSVYDTLLQCECLAPGNRHQWVPIQGNIYII
jgi:hypothetical protein